MKNVTKLLTKVVMLFALSFLLFSQVGWAADRVVTIGTYTGADGQYNVPFDGYYYNGRTQYVYLASEMTGLGAGQITKIAFNMSAIGEWVNPCTVRIKATTAIATTNPFSEGGFTTCWTGNYNPSLGWNTIVFTTPYVWDGTSNIIVDVCFTNSMWGIAHNRCYHTAYPAGLAAFLSDGTNGCTATSSTVLGWRANIQLSQPTGTLNGVVTSSYTSLPLVGATVTGGGSTATTVAGGAYSMTVTAGPGNFTASYVNYMNKTLSATVPDGGTATLNFILDPNPGVLTGHITNAANGAPIKGAKVVINGISTYSIEGGLYTLNVFPGGTWPVVFTKAGFSDSTTAPVTVNVGAVVTLDMAMKEATNPASQLFTAVVNTGGTAVNLNWGLPKGNYEIIYDDGVQEYSVVWGATNNLNAMKFTALNYPVQVVGGSVNIGKQSDYPAGTTIGSLSAFQMLVYDATGAGGTPGAQVGSAITVTPTTFGWNTFSFNNINIASGNFYLVMKQVGVPPAAARLGVDTTSNQLRAYSKYVTGGGQWLPAGGNFMIRAVLSGSGGPGDRPESITGYQLWSLLQGQEATPASWRSLTFVTGLSATDPGWPSFADGGYRWAVKAQYTGNRWSPPIFSNALGRNWTANVTVNVNLTCDSLAIAGTTITLHNILFDSTYTATLSSTHTAVFPTVWKGNYTLTVSRFNFQTYTLTPTAIFADKVYDVGLIQQKTPPTGMAVDAAAALATWNKPINDWVFNETWDSMSWTTNGWVADEDTGGLFGVQWEINGAGGNPAPTAEFFWDVYVYDYNLSLTSKMFTPPAGTRLLHLYYDILFDNYDADAATGLKVEILDGATWKLLKDYSAADGSFPFKTEDINLDAYKAKSFKIRFHAYGDDAFRVNWWWVDNIKLIGKNEDITPCILTYNVYLKDLTTSNEILSGQTTQTKWQFPAQQIKYGTAYTACVTALYGGGESTRSCANFTSKFLCPPTSLTGTPIESTAYLTWVAPSCIPGHIVDFILDQGMVTYGYYCSGSPVIEGLGNYFPITASTAGLIKSMDVYTFHTASETGAITYQMDVYSTAGVLLGTSATFVPLGATGSSGWQTVTLPDVPFSGPFYGCFRYNITNPAWVGTVLAYDTMYSIHHNNVGGYFEGAPWFWQLISAQGGKKGAFDIRVRAFVYDRNQEVVFGGDPAPVGGNGSNAPIAKLTPVTNNYIDPYTTLAPANVPPMQQGYTIWRDDVQIAALASNTTLEYYDYNLPSGIYKYDVKAFYDVSPFNPPSGKDNSLGAGPVYVNINFGRALPFIEPWDNGTFTFNNWSGWAGTNWTVNTGVGKPAPCADFSWIPAQTSGYDMPLVTPTLSAGPYSCATIWLDFDYKLISQNNTSNEMVDVQVKINNTWITKVILKNDKSYDWTTVKTKLAGAMGKAFAIRFRAHGNDSRDILHWYFDNIKVYAVCTRPTGLGYTQSHNTVNLTWTAPVCPKDQAFTIIYDDGSWENGWRGIGTQIWYGNIFQLTAGSSGYLTSFDVAFLSYGGSSPKTVSLDIYDGNHNLLGSSAPFLMQADQFQNVPVPMIVISDKFYGMINWSPAAGSSPYSHFLQLDQDGPYASDDYGTIYNGSTWSPISSQGYGPGVFMVRAHGVKFGSKSGTPFALLGGKTPLVDIPRTPSPLEMSNTKGDTYVRSGIGLIEPNNSESASLKGYNVYRTDSTMTISTFHKLNSALVTGTTYTDIIPLVGWGKYKYTVTASYNDTIQNTFLCESNGADTITVQFPHVGIVEIGSGQIMVYPNPATENVNVKSDYVISSIEVMNYVGQTVYRNMNVYGKLTQFNVSSLQAGIYFVKVATEQGTRTVKVTVTH